VRYAVSDSRCSAFLSPFEGKNHATRRSKSRKLLDQLCKREIRRIGRHLDMHVDEFIEAQSL
jgi:hypothetical protein